MIGFSPFDLFVLVFGTFVVGGVVGWFVAHAGIRN